MNDETRLRVLTECAQKILHEVETSDCGGCYHMSECGKPCAHEDCNLLRLMRRVVANSPPDDEFNVVRLHLENAELRHRLDVLGASDAEYRAKHGKANMAANSLDGSIRHALAIIKPAIDVAPRCSVEGCAEVATRTQDGVHTCSGHAAVGALKILGVHELATVHRILSDPTNETNSRILADADVTPSPPGA